MCHRTLPLNIDLSFLCLVVTFALWSCNHRQRFRRKKNTSSFHEKNANYDIASSMHPFSEGSKSNFFPLSHRELRKRIEQTLCFFEAQITFKGNESPLDGFLFPSEKKVKKLLWSPPKVYFEKCQSSFCLFFSLSLSFFLSLIGFVGSIPLSVSLDAGMQRVQEQQQQYYRNNGWPNICSS